MIKNTITLILCVWPLIKGNQSPSQPDIVRLIHNKHYIDKTPLLVELLTHDYAVVTAPRKFGKSTNIAMMRTFLQMAVDSEGEPISNVIEENGEQIEKEDSELSENYKLFKNQQIYQNKAFYYQHCANHTVVHVSFKCSGKLHDFVDCFKKVISNSFAQHKYIVDKLDEEDKTRFNHLLEGRDVTIAGLQCALTFLARVLNQHYRKKPIVLIDDFDTPIIESIYKSHKEIEKLIEFIRLVYSHFLIENRNIQRCLISANNVKIAKLLAVYVNHDRYNPLFPNEFEFFPFLSNSTFTQYYGLTENEVRALLKNAGLKEKRKAVKYWYAYKLTGKMIKLFNTWSILEFLKKGEIDSYWIESYGERHLKEIFLNEKIQGPMDLLVSGEEIELKDIKLDIGYIMAMHRIFKKPLGHKLKKDNVDYGTYFLHFLMDNGYFNVELKDDDFLLRIPNKEVAHEFAENLHTVTFYVDKYNYDYSRIEDVVDTFKTIRVGNPQAIKDFEASVTAMYADRNVDLPKNDFQFYSALYVFVSTFGEFYRVLGESHCIGPRGLDLIVVRKEGTAIALQTRCGAGSELEALKQIMFDEQYCTILKQRYGDVNITHTIHIGLHLGADRVASTTYFGDDF
uniref:AAA-ATPase-like domain-containing protein n=1 Tax=Clastoptera arizonana TaxID=38151 RepID=A0A1B6CSL7_9HEMI